MDHGYVSQLWPILLRASISRLRRQDDVLLPRDRVDALRDADTSARAEARSQLHSRTVAIGAMASVERDLLDSVDFTY